MIRTEESGSRPLLDVLPLHEQKSRMPLLVGEVKLSELRKVLIQEGFNATFAKGGVLVVNNRIVIRKDEDGSLVLNGSLCSDYYKIRSFVYQQQAII